MPTASTTATTHAITTNLRDKRCLRPFAFALMRGVPVFSETESACTFSEGFAFFPSGIEGRGLGCAASFEGSGKGAPALPAETAGAGAFDTFTLRPTTEGRLLVFFSAMNSG